MITQLTPFTPLELNALEECSEASIYAPGHIQPEGILLKLQDGDLKIVQVSETVESFFGISAAALLGQPLQRLFSRPQVLLIAEYLTQNDREIYNPFELKTRRNLTGADQCCKPQIFRSTLHRIPDGLLLELEPQLPPQKADAIQFYHRLQVAILKLRNTSSLLDLAQTLALEVKEMTGFDRVMVYRFEADDHGVVIAEAKESHLESYLGLHYPAIDIPQPARKLFYRNWIRQIPNVNYTPARLIAIDDQVKESPLDLSECVLRGVSPYHIEYLQNMGIAASLTISLIDDRHLWGLIACHHYSPRRVDYETRKTCEFLGQFASIELVHQQQRELSLYRTQVKTIHDQLQQTFRQEPYFIEQVLSRSGDQLLDLVHAQGAAIWLDERLTLIGQTPSQKQVQELITELIAPHQERVFATSRLSEVYPPGKAFKDQASGVLAISIRLNPSYCKSYHIIWFRPEQIQTVNWAGNPYDAVIIDNLGELRLCPRKSFELWKETVREMSLPWQMAELEAAAEMRNILMLAVLEFSQAALEQAAERAAIANRAKSHFLAKMSHELRTPLNAILGFTQLMNRHANIPLEFQEHLAIISNSGEHLLTLINDILEMSRIEAGELVLTSSCFDLHRLLAAVYKMFVLKATEKGLNLIGEWEETVPRYVCGDQAKLRQILINLLGNAIKFTATGQITLRGRAILSESYPLKEATAPSLKSPITLYLQVVDTGCGIGDGDLESIFEAFMQTDQGRHAQGTGLGLSISRQFARLMGGDLTVASTLNQGATFTCKVVLQMPESLDIEEASVNRYVMGLEAGQPTYRILVAEDVPENRQLLVALLESVGFEASTVENGSEAIACWQTEHPHLILMDISMPILDGYEATRQIRSLEAERNTQQPEEPQVMTPIIALTALAFEEDRLASLQAGCSDYIAKPFTETRLFETIARHLGVRYCYADKIPQELSSSKPKTLTPQDLKMMSTDWVVQVHEAALDLRDSRLRQLIDQIPKEKQDLIEAMTALVDNFQLEAIAILTQI